MEMNSIHIHKNISSTVYYLHNIYRNEGGYILKNQPFIRLNTPSGRQFKHWQKDKKSKTKHSIQNLLVVESPKPKSKKINKSIQSKPSHDIQSQNEKEPSHHSDKLINQKITDKPSDTETVNSIINTDDNNKLNANKNNSNAIFNGYSKENEDNVNESVNACPKYHPIIIPLKSCVLDSMNCLNIESSQENNFKKKVLSPHNDKELSNIKVGPNKNLTELKKTSKSIQNNDKTSNSDNQLINNCTEPVQKSKEKGPISIKTNNQNEKSHKKILESSAKNITSNYDTTGEISPVSKITNKRKIVSSTENCVSSPIKKKNRQDSLISKTGINSGNELLKNRITVKAEIHEQMNSVTTSTNTLEIDNPSDCLTPLNSNASESNIIYDNETNLTSTPDITKKGKVSFSPLVELHAVPPRTLKELRSQENNNNNEELSPKSNSYLMLSSRYENLNGSPKTNGIIPYNLKQEEITIEELSLDDSMNEQNNYASEEDTDFIGFENSFIPKPGLIKPKKLSSLVANNDRDTIQNKETNSNHEPYVYFKSCKEVFEHLEVKYKGSYYLLKPDWQPCVNLDLKKEDIETEPDMTIRVPNTYVNVNVDEMTKEEFEIILKMSKIYPDRFLEKGAILENLDTDQDEFFCEICNESYRLYSSLEKHMWMHYPKQTYKCEVCDFKCSTITVFRKHQWSHTGEKPYICPLCSFRSANSGNLTAHMIRHTGFKHYKCHHCNYKTDHSSALQAHVSTHLKYKPFKCKDCDYTATCIQYVQAHARNCHSDRRPHKCDECPLSFKLKHNLTTHKLIHTNIRPYKCSYCKYSAKQQSSLNKHIKVMHKIDPKTGKVFRPSF